MDDSIQREVEFRLKTAEGQVRAVERMVASGQSCTAILSQIFAVQRALDEVARLLVDGYSEQCLGLLTSAEGDDEFEHAVHSLAEVYRETDRLKVPSAPVNDHDGIGVDPRRDK